MKKLSLIIGVAALFFVSCNQKAEKTPTEQEQQIETEAEVNKDIEQAKNDTAFSAEALGQEFIGLDGKNINLQQILDKNQGNVVLIDVWASWCKDCIKAFETTHKIQQEFPEVSFVYLSADKTEEAWKEGIEKFKLDGDHFYIPNGEGMKGGFGKAIDLNWIPRYIVLDKDAKIALYNATEKNLDEVRALLKNLEE